MKDQSVWYKINKDSPVEYAATVTVNPLTALRMLEDFVTLNSGTFFFFCHFVCYELITDYTRIYLFFINACFRFN